MICGFYNKNPHYFSDYYFTAISWVKSESVAVIWMNRPQNLSLVTQCNPPAFICKEVSMRFPAKKRPWSKNNYCLSNASFFAQKRRDFCCNLIFFPQTYRETVGKEAWSTLYDPPVYANNGSSFLLLAPVRDGVFGDFRHLSLIETERTHLVHPITLGQFEVDKILAWDQKKHRM